MKATKSFFSLCDPEKKFPGYTTGQTWNGFACPYFELEMALKIAAYTTDENEGFTIVYNEKEGFFIHTSHDEYEIISSLRLDTIDGIKTVYPMGAFGWVWLDEGI